MTQEPGTLAMAAPAIHKPARYDRRELDAIRFFAFSCVVLRHGLVPPFRGGNLIAGCGSFGLSMFFFLSAFLITELLLREREKTGDVHLRNFYVRRILRIWPLYFLGVALAVAAGFVDSEFWITKWRLLSMVLFFTNWSSAPFAGPFTPLWSISVEEQFYAIWPMAIKSGRKVLLGCSALLIAGSMVTISIGVSHGYHLWTNTFSEFLFFGTGAITAISLHRRQWNPRTGERIILLTCGLFLWPIAQRFGKVASADPVHIPWLACMSYLAVAIGCLLILISVYGIRQSLIPEWLRYLGKISYGLYVFHKTFLILLEQFTVHWSSALARFLCVDGGAILCALVVASISWRFMESPINRLKERFAFVPSRPV